MGMPPSPPIRNRWEGKDDVFLLYLSVYVYIHSTFPTFRSGAAVYLWQIYGTSKDTKYVLLIFIAGWPVRGLRGGELDDHHHHFH